MRESVIYQGIKAAGKAEKARERVINMLNLDIKMEQVAQITGLTVEQTKQLHQSH